MVSSDSTRLGIVERQKYPPEGIPKRYRDARPAIQSYLRSTSRSTNALDATERRLAQRAQDTSQSSQVRNDAEQSIEALREIRLINELSRYEFVSAPRNHRPFSFDVNGVSVSGYVDLLVHSSHRGTGQIGAAMLRMTKDDTGSEEAQRRRREMGEYAATILYMLMQRSNWSDRTLVHRLCMSIDVRVKTVFKAPRSNVKRIRNLEAACRTIALQWETIP